MQLLPGARLGPYEVVSSIGAGGMGEVYLGRDTRLDRSVAIKVLPPLFASDPDRRTRFEREARVVAGLSHPNICSVHDVGVTPDPAGGDVPYIVMEHLEGETLDRRIAAAPLRLHESIALALEIARGLDAAHRQRIVHRDLKPSNIMVTRSGVKLLDFGLAKALDRPADDASGSTIAVSAVTSPGTVLGTVPYMAPEQIEGRPVDARADIFALGCVIYEMTAGRRAFAGESPAAVAAAILSSEPPPLTVSPTLDTIVRGCLRKDPDRRWQSAYDVALQLEALAAAPQESPTVKSRTSHLPWILAAASLGIAAVTALVAWSNGPSSGARGPAPDRAVALTIDPPPGHRFSMFVEYSFVSVSPDGSSVAYVVVAPGKEPTLWVRRISSIDARPIAGTEGAISAFWSPDGRDIAFFAKGWLKRVPASGGGAPVPLCEVSRGVGLMGTWGANGDILYSSVAGPGIMRTRSTGGAASVVLEPDPTKQVTRVTLPSFLPDGRRFLYLAAGSPDHVGTIMLGSLDGPPVEVLRQQSMAQYVEPGYLVFVQDSAIVARRFDAATGQVSGETIAVAPRVNWLHSTGVVQFSASFSGVLAFLPDRDEGRIASFDRTGRELAEVRGTGSYQSLRVSRDGRQLLFDRLDLSVASFDVWLQDLERGGEERVTSHIGSEVSATWIPGGGFLYVASRGSPPRLHQRASAASEEVALFDAPGAMQIYPDISSDGSSAVFAERGPSGAFQLMWMQMRDRRPQRLHPAVNDEETTPRLSPDGTLLTYASDVSGRREVYVEPFRSAQDRKTVSVGGGSLPRWSRDGEEIYYISTTGDLQAVRVTGSPLAVSKPVRVFENRGPRWGDYDVSADGRFFAHQLLKVAAEQPFTVLVNWPSLVNQ